jgi:hypothetical protein
MTSTFDLRKIKEEILEALDELKKRATRLDIMN